MRVFLLLCLLWECAVGGRFLLAPPSFSPSHKMALMPLADGLAEKGHDVLVWEVLLQPSKYHPAKARQNSTLVSLDWPEINEGVVEMSTPEVHEMVWAGAVERPHDESAITAISSFFCREFLETRGAEFAALAAEAWDVMVLDELFNPCAYAMAEVLKRRHGTRIVLYQSTVRLTPTGNAANGLPIISSFQPPYGSFIHYADRMTFLQRVHSTLMTQLRLLCQDLAHAFIDWNIGAFLPADRGNIRAGVRHPDLVLSASLQELQLPAPRLHSVISVAGVHMAVEAKSRLSAEWESLLGQYRGFILVSTGHLASWEWAPPAIVDAFVAGFSALPSDVLVVFQCRGGFPEARLPPNVRIFKWLPQRQLLRSPRLVDSSVADHPRILGFLTHGGASSVSEATMAGVPMLALPLFAEQPDGATLVHAAGNGRRLDKFRLTNATLVQGLQDLVGESGWREHARRLSAMMGVDPAQTALDKGLYWLEFLGRRKSPSPYKSRALVTRYGWVYTQQYYSIDVLLAALSAFSLVPYIWWRLWSRCCSSAK